jgi:hypothetical protein
LSVEEHENGDHERGHARAWITHRFWPALFVIWASVVFIAYYRVHKPFGWSNLLALSRLAIDLTAWFGTLSIAHALGRFVISDQISMKPRTSFSLRLGLGLGLIGIVMVLLGALGGYRSALVWAVLIIGQIPALPAFVRELRHSLPSIPGTRWQRIFACGLFLLISMAFLDALAPPTGYDALVYHLTGPKLYAQAHTLHHNLDLPHLGFPQAGEMLFTWALLLDGPQVAQLLHWSFMLLSLALFGDLVGRFAPRHTYLASLLLLGTPSLFHLTGQAYVEWIPIFGGIAAVVVMGEMRSSLKGLEHESRVDFGVDRKNLHLVILSAFFAALAFNAKYTSVGLVAGLGFAFLYTTRSARASALAAGAFVIFASPYLLKNFWLTGNPVYPFFFGGKYWDALRTFWYGRLGTGLSLAQVLRAPWDMTVAGVEGGAVAGFPSYGATVGPLFLALLPLVVLAFSWLKEPLRAMIIRVGWIALIGYCVWLIQTASSALLVQSRLLFPVWPFFLLLIVKGFERLWQIGSIARSVAVILLGLMVLAIALTLFNQFIAFQRRSPVQYLLGMESENHYLGDRLGQYFLAIEKVNGLPKGAAVQFLWEPRTYHCAQHIICNPDAILDRWWHTRQLVQDPDDIASSWKAQGVTHVFLARPGLRAVRAAGFDPLDEADWQALEAFIDVHLEPLGGSEDLYALFELR